MANAKRDDRDAHRMVLESDKDPQAAGGSRGPFQRDRARVLHCAAFRRLAAKTQVHSPGDDQFIRTRLTHSLEVAQIAREMGASLGCEPDVVDTAGLAHDLGHPPFGHVGEEVLDEVAASCGGFEGNAQTLRLLTRLEAKVVDPDGRPAGLNLTRACLDAVTKYPWPRTIGQHKYGVYDDDTEVFTWFRSGRPDGLRCLEAQVMDWADDVAYSVHDVEDGIHDRLITLTGLRADPDERLALCHDVAGRYSTEQPGELAAVLGDLLSDPMFDPLGRYDATHGSQVALKRFTSVMTGRFVAAAVRATRSRYGDQPLRRYGADLVVPRLARAQCALLKGMALRYVMRGTHAAARYGHQQDLLRSLVHGLLQRAPDGLEPMFAARWTAAGDDPARTRVVIDQVASLTDPGAESLYRSLR